MKVAIVLLAIVAVVAADSYDKGYKQSYTTDYRAPPHYKFSWDVKDDYYYADMGQQEDRYNDNTKGSYWVNLPDGRKQVVNYYVDDYSGYVADVSYEGGYKSYSAPAYKESSYQPSYQNDYKQSSYQPSYHNSYKSSY